MKSHYLSLLLLTLLTAVTSTFAAERAVLPTSGGSAQVVPGSRALGRVMPLPSMNDIFGQHMQDCVSAEALFASGFRMGTNGELFVVLNGQG